MWQSEKVLSHPTNSSVYLSLLVNGSCMDLFLFSHRKHQSSPDLEMYYLTAETKCYLTAAVTSPHFESLKSLTKPLAHGITDGSLSHGKHSTEQRSHFHCSVWNRKYHPSWHLLWFKCQRVHVWGTGIIPEILHCPWRDAMSWALHAERAGAGTQGWHGMGWDGMGAAASLQKFSHLP